MFDPVRESVIGKAKRVKIGDVVSEDGSLLPTAAMEVIPVDEFYDHEAVSDLVPEGSQHGCQVHVKCLNCGFETVYGLNALYGRYGSNDHPEANCDECELNVWEEVERQYSPCDWSDSFEWAEAP